MKNDHLVYVIAVDRPDQPAGPVKVGVTRNVGSRLGSLQTGCPFPLKVVHIFPVPDRDIALGAERAFHTVLKKHRMSGEWFDLSPKAAVEFMCLNIEAMLRWLEIPADEMAACLEMSGVTKARDILKQYQSPPIGVSIQ